MWRASCSDVVLNHSEGLQIENQCINRWSKVKLPYAKTCSGSEAL